MCFSHQLKQAAVGANDALAPAYREEPDIVRVRVLLKDILKNMLTLIAMSEDEFCKYQSTAIQAFADEHIRSGKWSAAEGLAEASKVHQDLLPQGLQTKDHYFWSLFLPESQEIIGMLWFANIEKAGKRIAYVYDFVINPEWRRRGYGEQAFKLMEEKVKSLGLSSIALHVFGHNHAAYALYQKMGYVATNINMSKSLID